MLKGKQGILACCNCFKDQGLRLHAQKIGVQTDSQCPNCEEIGGYKLDDSQLSQLTFQFFVQGSIHRSHFGAANAIEFNEYHFNRDDITVPSWLTEDMKLIGQLLKIGFFEYAPQLWRLGHIEPLGKLQSEPQRQEVIEEIMTKFPKIILPKETSFYRLRKNPVDPIKADEYDSPPDPFVGNGRLDSKGLPVLYGSQDLDICVHESRATIEDELYVATLHLAEELSFLDLTEQIKEGKTAFESLNIAIRMLFMAPAHAYEIIREIAKAAEKRGFDGLIYPSYFSQVHTTKGIIGNLALFGRPISKGKVSVKCINRLMLNKVIYDLKFGPGGYQSVG